MSPCSDDRACNSQQEPGSACKSSHPKLFLTLLSIVFLESRFRLPVCLRFVVSFVSKSTKTTMMKAPWIWLFLAPFFDDFSDFPEIFRRGFRPRGQFLEKFGVS